MKKFLLVLGIALLALIPLSGHSQASTTVTVTNAWTRATPMGVSSSAVYLDITSGTADRVVGAESPVAAQAALHSHMMANGVMMMRALDGVDLSAGERFRFAPMGYHIMLTGLKAPLKPGDHFPLILIMEKSGRVEFDVHVVPLRQHRAATNAPVTPPAQDMGAMPGMSGMEMTK